jgi:predicted Zn finger-like uncharacterized protein
MFTRCPECQSLYRLTPEQLRIARGKVRCGKCSNVFDALDQLVEQSDDDQAAASDSAHQPTPDEDTPASPAADDEDGAVAQDQFGDTRQLDEELLEASGILEAPEFANDSAADEDAVQDETEEHNPDQQVFSPTATASDSDEVAAETNRDEATAGPLSAPMEAGPDPWQDLFFDDEHGIPDSGAEPATASSVGRIDLSRDVHTSTHWNMEPLSSEHDGDEDVAVEAEIGTPSDEQETEPGAAEEYASPREDEEAVPGGTPEMAEHSAAEEHTSPREDEEAVPGGTPEIAEHSAAEEHTSPRESNDYPVEPQIQSDSATPPPQDEHVEPAAKTGSSEDHGIPRTFLQRLWGGRKDKEADSVSARIAAVFEPAAAAKEADTSATDDIWDAAENAAPAVVDAGMAGVFDDPDELETAQRDFAADTTEPESGEKQRAPEEHAADSGHDNNDGAAEAGDDRAVSFAAAGTEEDAQPLARDDGKVAAVAADPDGSVADEIDLEKQIDAAIEALEEPDEPGSGDEASQEQIDGPEQTESTAVDARDDDEYENAVDAVLAALFSDSESEENARQVAAVADDRDGSVAVNLGLDEELDAVVDALSDEHHEEAVPVAEDEDEDDDDDDFAGAFEGLDALNWSDDEPAAEPSAAEPSAAEPSAAEQEAPPDSAANESRPDEQSLLEDILRENEQKTAPTEIVAEASGIRVQLLDESDLDDVDDEAWENLSAQLGLGPDSETGADRTDTEGVDTDSNRGHDEEVATGHGGTSSATGDEETDRLYETFLASTVTPADPQLDSAVAEALGDEQSDQPETPFSPPAASSAAPFPGSPPPRGKRVLFAAASFALALLLVIQLIHARRDELLQDSALAPALRSVYQAFGYQPPENWDLSAYDLRQMSAVVNPDSPAVIRIKISLRDRAARAQPYPVIRLILIDIWGEPIGQRDLLPAQYLGSEPPPLLEAGKNVTGEIAVVEPQDQKAENFEIDACLALVAGVLECANPR